MTGNAVVAPVQHSWAQQWFVFVLAAGLVYCICRQLCQKCCVSQVREPACLVCSIVDSANE